MKYSDNVLSIAKDIATNCQGNENSYCVAECPMHTDVLGYVNLIGEGKCVEALKKIREKLFLPATLGRICAHPCEKKCKRNVEFNEPISIASLKRYAADNFDDEKLWDTSKKPATGKKVAIVGAGPAGAQAGIDLAKEGHSVTIFEKLDVVGGMMRVGIPEYRLPRNIIDFEYSYLTKLGIEIKLGVEIGKDILFSKLQEDYDAVIIANGAHKGNLIPIEGVNSTGVTTAPDYLKEISLTKKSSIAGKNIVVIGGGDVAMDCARSSFRVGADTVNLVSLEKEEQLPASHHEQVGSKEEGVVFNCGFGPAEVIVDEQNKVKGIKLVECTSVFDADGKFNPTYSEKTKIIDCDTVIFATGQIVEDVTEGKVEQTRGGRFVCDKDTLATSINNVFVAGDNAGGTIVVGAMALGRKASISVNNYLNGKDLKADRNLLTESAYETNLDLPLPEGTEDTKRASYNMLDPMKRRTNFTECDLGYTREIATKEASRCLKCECKKCMKECIMLTEYSQYPGDLFSKFIETGDFEPLVAYSCNMCNQCTIVCPEEFPFAEFFGAIRKDFVKANNGNSPMEGHKSINMHQLLGFSKLFTTKIKGGKK